VSVSAYKHTWYLRMCMYVWPHTDCCLFISFPVFLDFWPSRSQHFCYPVCIYDVPLPDYSPFTIFIGVWLDAFFFCSPTLLSTRVMSLFIKIWFSTGSFFFLFPIPFCSPDDLSLCTLIRWFHSPWVRLSLLFSLLAWLVRTRSGIDVQTANSYPHQMISHHDFYILCCHLKYSQDYHKSPHH